MKSFQPLIHTGDQSGECRAHGNLGSALFSKGSYREALANHRNQLVLAMKLKDREVSLHACVCGERAPVYSYEQNRVRFTIPLNSKSSGLHLAGPLTQSDLRVTM